MAAMAAARSKIASAIQTNSCRSAGRTPRSAHDPQIARRVVSPITNSAQSAQQSAPQAAHEPAATAWQ
jgi:hypothetical protein